MNTMKLDNIKKFNFVSYFLFLENIFILKFLTLFSHSSVITMDLLVFLFNDFLMLSRYHIQGIANWLRLREISA